MTMTVFEIISGVCMIISSIAIIILCLLQGKKEKNMTSAITGTQSDSFYGKNSGRTLEAKLSKLTKVFAIFFFVVTLAMNIVPTIIK